MKSPLRILIPALLLSALPAVVASEAKQPNIVLIVADDLGFTGLGCYGSTFYETPNIDRLAEGGVRFINAFSAAANCAPSRASIMSGQYTPRHGILYVGPGDYQKKWKAKKGDLSRFEMLQPRGETTLDPAVETVASALRRGGYRTAMFGKWHLGNKDQHPSKRGFDIALESHGAHFGFHTDPETAHDDGVYLSDSLSDRAVAFIEEGAAGKKPFFLYYADFLVHKPLETKQQLLEHFRAKEPSERQRDPVAGAMIKALDDSVGKITAALERLGLEEDTLLIFTSDNGGLSYEADGLREKNTSNLPLRGRKGSEFDGGLRVPWIARWTGKIPAGEECTTPVHHIDLFPTLLAAGGVEPPDQPLDGVDLLPAFKNPAVEMKKRALFWYLPGYSAFNQPSVIARKGDWKLIRRLHCDETLLFQTRDDIGEKHDRASRNAPIAQRLLGEAERWLDDLDAPRMRPNPEYRKPKRP